MNVPFQGKYFLCQSSSLLKLLKKFSVVTVAYVDLYETCKICSRRSNNLNLFTGKSYLNKNI